MPDIPLHARVHRANSPDGIPVLIHLAVTDTTRSFVVTDDLGGTYVRSVHATISIAGSTATTVEAENITTAENLLTTDTTIDSGATSSYSAAIQHVVDRTGTPATNRVARGDVLQVTVTLGTDAEDPTVLLEFGPQLVKLT